VNEQTESKYRPVKMAGMVFARLSSRERAVTAEGRHFFCVGRDSAGWTLFEHDGSITDEKAVAGGVRSIGRKFERLADSEELVEEILRLVEKGEHLPNDRRPPWEIDEPRHAASQIAVARRRIDKAHAKAQAKMLKETAKADRDLKKAGIVQCEHCLLARNIKITHCPHCGQP
jgi:hypothetical protein